MFYQKPDTYFAYVHVFVYKYFCFLPQKNHVLGVKSNGENCKEWGLKGHIGNQMFCAGKKYIT